MRKLWRFLKNAALFFCVVVTIGVVGFFLSYPRQCLDFVQVFYLLRQDFRQPLNAGQMLEGAVGGLAEAADDHYTYYLPAERNLAAVTYMQGLTGGIGVIVDSEKTQEDRLLIREVKEGSAAAAAGLRADDAILRIDDHWVEDLTSDEVVAMVRGEPDTEVRLLIARAGEDEREYRLRRTYQIQVETVQGGFLTDEYLPNRKVGYLAIDHFAQNSGAIFQETLDALLREGAAALVLDLRYNGGGDLGATSEIAGRLLPNGPLLRLTLREDEQEFIISGADPITIPYVVLVNGGSASASEVLAGAIQDRAGGILVGSRTYGKGSVQSVYRLLTGGGLRVTEGLYALPGGRYIDGEGILPDYPVEREPDADEDAQLTMALSLLEEILAGRETVATLLAASPRAESADAADAADSLSVESDDSLSVDSVEPAAEPAR
ncbi:MAG: PDZ domain-containing protein [Peptococcaceae bacterium]|jgi:carboxyl-terminal processing protease|nr:PDZ domain-containing protein [Peptococcaceae bacterium]